ncbi:MAG: hypothetical protein WC700_10340 [Gemmatimonadaceae bacterium]|jgi:hypothetical protein
MSGGGQQIAALVKAAGTSATSLGRALPGDAGVVASIVGALVTLGGELLSSGVDPVAELRRMMETAGERAKVRAAWDAALRKRYGGGLDPYGDG